MAINTNESIKQYNDLFYASRPVKYNDYVSDKYNDVHKQLYNAALDLLIADIIADTDTSITVEKFKKTHKFIEIKPDEYWKPSDVVIISMTRPYTKTQYSLMYYWNGYQGKREKDILTLKLTPENIKDSEVIEFNYLTGKAKMRSKMADVEYWVDFDYLNQYTFVSEDVKPKNTFSNLLQEIK